MHFKPHDYQSYCIGQIIARPKLGLFLEMGLGKTVITLTAIKQMLGLEVSKVLVVAPLRVAESGWLQETRKWDHLADLRVVRVLGTEKQRKWALAEDGDIYVINRENVAWLVEFYERDWPFDMVVLDELSSFKNPQSRRFKAMKRVLHSIDRMVGLTGTPAPNSLIDLWAQVFLLDGGERLGKFIGRYRDAFFTHGTLPNGIPINYKLRPGAEEQIYKRIRDLCVSMKAVDYITLPERVDNLIEVDIGESALTQYRTMEREMVLELEAQEHILASSASVVAQKLLQMANGCIYDSEHAFHPLHDAKLDALMDIIEGACGHPVLIYYGYRFDEERIYERLRGSGYRIATLNGSETVEAWNGGHIDVLLAHPDSAGHGLNLQAGGHIMVWYGLTWSLEKYQQACARLHRQGQRDSVIIHHIIAKGTIDEDVMRALERKEKGQDALFGALRARLIQYKED